MRAQAAPSAVEPALLSVAGLDAGYGKLQVVHDVGLRVGAGEAVGMIGHNGAGKTTILKTIFGGLRPNGGEITYRDESRSASECHDSIVRGMAFVPADGYIFAPLSVRENLQIARLNATSQTDADAAEAMAFELFPIVAERLDQISSTLSGGERRMLGIAMALMWSPRLLLLDEPSLGLAPAIAGRVFAALGRLVSETGISVLCVEQNVAQLLSLVNRVYVIRSGRVVDEKPATELAKESDLWRYF